MARCGQNVGRERIGDEPWQLVECLLPEGHKGPHADWTAWLGIERPDFSAPGAEFVPSIESCISYGPEDGTYDCGCDGECARVVRGLPVTEED
jgi:hypothetical protein